MSGLVLKINGLISGIVNTAYLCIKNLSWIPISYHT